MAYWLKEIATGLLESVLLVALISVCLAVYAI